MSQRGRIRVSTITESKMFAKKMHRLVKKMQDKPSDSLDPLELLSEMARKGGANLSIPIEVETETQWATLLKREGLIVVDVYSGWSGPCTSMFSILRKLKLDTNDDRMILAAANADNISQLAPFRNQSEPCWLFMGGGKPVNVLRGSNAPKLVRTIKSELQYELGCIEGKNKRNLISIKYEASRREQAVNEAIALDQLIALEEEERKAKEKEPSPPAENSTNEETEVEESVVEKESSEIVDGDENAEEEAEADDEEENLRKEQEAKNEAEALLQQERRKLMEESNVRLQDALRMYTVIAIQSYLLETGAVTEIKDHLSSDFNLVKERYINLTDDDARKLFGIPAEMPDPNPPVVVHEEESNNADATGLGEGEDADSNAEGEKVPSIAPSPIPGIIEASESETEKKDGENTDENHEGSDGENDESNAEEKKPVVRMIEIPVPSVLIGDTLILLLECTKVEPKKKVLVKEEENEEGEESEDIEIDEDAEFFIAKRIGSEDFEIATETQPESLHAMYGKEKYVAGIWCPRKYEEKRFVMLNYFPQFVTEMLMPPIPDPPKYQLYVFSALFSTEILEHPEYIKHKGDVIAEKRRRIPQTISEKLLIASKREGELLRALKWALTGTELFIVSIDGKNFSLTQILQCFNPIFISEDNIEAGYFTSKIFPDVEVLIDEEPFIQSETDNPLLAISSSNLANLVVKMREDLTSNKGSDDEDECKIESTVPEETEETKRQISESDANQHLTPEEISKDQEANNEKESLPLDENGIEMQ